MLNSKDSNTSGPPAFKSGKIKLDRLKKEPESPTRTQKLLVGIQNPSSNVINNQQRSSPDKITAIGVGGE